MRWYSFYPKLKNQIGKWRILFLIFMAGYLGFLLLNLGYMAIQWDEANHLNGGLLLFHGQFEEYMTSSMFYPPLYDLIQAGYFAIAGPSVFVGRLTTVTFAALCVWVVFEFVYRTYGPRTALVSSILLGTMPGFVWISRVAMIETTLNFFLSASMILFFLWLQKHDDKILILSGIALGLGFLAKYQIVVAVLAMFVSIFLLCRGYLKAKLARLPLLILTAVVVVLPWIIIAYQVYSTGILSQWLYAVNVGNPQKSVYSMRFPTPVFYLIEMTWPYGVVHPISLFVYAFGLLGLGLFIWRRKPEDKFLLVWFFTIYVFFTAIGNRQWRYVLPIFPVLAVSGASLISFVFEKIHNNWKKTEISSTRIRLGKVAAGCLIAIVVFSVVYSCVDVNNWIAKDNVFNLPSDQAAEYAVARLGDNESLVVLCPINVFSADIVKFYVDVTNQKKQICVWQYPELPVDTYKPIFNLDELISMCVVYNAEYLLLFEYGETYPYFDTNLTMEIVKGMLMSSQRFSCQAAFGNYPSRIYVLSFA